MKIKPFVVLVLGVIFLSGCVNQPQMSREDIIKATTRTYNKTPEEILIASDKLLKLADGNDFIIKHTEESITATRAWIIYMVIGGASGSDRWAIKTKKNVDGLTNVNVEVTTQGAFLGSNSYVGERIITGTALYDLYFNRLEYLLGLKKEWLTCSESDQKIKRGDVWGSTEQLCSSFNITDDLPAELKKQ